MVLALTTLERVRVLLEQRGAYTENDAVIDNLIQSVSLSIERYCNRPFLIASKTEYFDVRTDQFNYQLEAFPVSSLTSVKNSGTRDWTVDAKVEGTDFVLDTDTGILRQLTGFTTGLDALQVVYMGGLAADTAAVLSDYPDLADACEKQITEEFRRRDGLGRTGVSVEGSSVTTQSAVRLLDTVVQRLAPYRRPVF